VKVKNFDLFSGVGGFRLALKNVAEKFDIKSKCVGYSEIDKFARKTYESNFKIKKDEIVLKDIKNTTEVPSDKNEIDAKELKKMDDRIDQEITDFNILFAGFPCQSFSLMGDQKGFRDTRGTLFFDIERVISAKKPEFILLENVRGLQNHDGGETFKVIKDILRKRLGYSIKWWVLNSSDYGVPQTRRRLFILGFKKQKRSKELKGKPEEIDLKETENPTVWHLLEKDVGDKYYLSEKIKKTILSNGSGGFKAKSEINQSIARPLCATMHKMHRACQDNYYSDPYIYGDYDRNKNQIILNNEYDGSRIRRITPLEAFRFQGFPDEFVKNARKAGVSDTQMYRQAGNTVSVPVVEKILFKVFSETNLIGDILG